MVLLDSWISNYRLRMMWILCMPQKCEGILIICLYNAIFLSSGRVPVTPIGKNEMLQYTLCESPSARYVAGFVQPSVHNNSYGTESVIHWLSSYGRKFKWVQDFAIIIVMSGLSWGRGIKVVCINEIIFVACHWLAWYPGRELRRGESARLATGLTCQ